MDYKVNVKEIKDKPKKMSTRQALSMQATLSNAIQNRQYMGNQSAVPPNQAKNDGFGRVM